MANIENLKTSGFERIKNFNEEIPFIPLQWAVLEAKRCIQCFDAPCIKGCPVEIDIPKFIRYISERNFRGAGKVIKEKNILPSICARVCPTENLCEKGCTSSKLKKVIAIGLLQRFAMEEYYKKEVGPRTEDAEKNGIKVAVIGSGPAGLSCATKLRKLGYEVYVFEEKLRIGGLIHSIPEFRLPKKIVEIELENLKKEGIHFILNTKIHYISVLFQNGYRAVFLATGLNKAKNINIKEENLKSVFQWDRFLFSPPSLKNVENVVVIGGGNTAIDCARSAIRLGAMNSVIVYRRSIKELPAFPSELVSAQEEGVKFIFQSVPEKLIFDENGNLCRLRLLKTQPSHIGEDRRMNFSPVPHSDFEIPAEIIITAVGQMIDEDFVIKNPDLILSKNGFVQINKETMMTSIKGVFAGGDLINGGGTVVEAISDGKKAAISIDNYIKKGEKKCLI